MPTLRPKLQFNDFEIIAFLIMLVDESLSEINIYDIHVFTCLHRSIDSSLAECIFHLIVLLIMTYQLILFDNSFYALFAGLC